MFSLPYVYLYIISDVLILSLTDALRMINPANPFIKPIMGISGGITRVANIVLLILCIFFAPHWWYAPIMWVCALALSIFIKVIFGDITDIVLGFLAVIAAPICTIGAYICLF